MSSHEMTRFARDRDRILSSRPFRRLAAKTQVVALPADPLVRTRLTHTMEVSSIAREIGAALGLCDPLLDAIALGHDLGHPAFGHAGERALAALVPGGFHHAAHSVRVVTVLEPGLDLTPEVVDGIFKHSKGRAGGAFARGGALASLTSEGRAVRAADLYAYACHDLDDAYLLGTLRRSDLPPSAVKVLGAEPESVRRALVTSTVRASLERGDISLDPEAERALQTLRSFLYDRLYEGARISAQTAFVRSLFESLWGAALERPGQFVATLGASGFAPGPSDLPLTEVFVDALAGMGDKQALALGRALRLPRKAISFPKHISSLGMLSESTPGD